MAEYELPDECFYTREDEWVRHEGDKAYVGVTDYAQDQLGDMVFVELPEVGATVSQGEVFGVVESVKAVSDLYAPISGEVVEVNTDLSEEPTPSWGIVNLKAGFTSNSWRIQLILGNIFDKTYHEHFSYLRNPYRTGAILNEPGRNVTINLGWRY
jgi:glycine cleavage system H protein